MKLFLYSFFYGVLFCSNLFGQIDSTQFYKSLEERSKRTKIGNILYDALIIDRSDSLLALQRRRFATYDFDLYQDRLITKIDIVVLDVFGPSVNQPYLVSQNTIERFANSIHVNTIPFIVKNNLLIKEGQAFNALKAAESERILRSLPYINDARVIPTAHGDNDVSIKIIVHDGWSLTPELFIDPIRPSGFIKFRDENFGGLGQTAIMRYEFRNDSTFFHRFESLYSVPNIKGTYIDFYFKTNFTENTELIELDLHRRFLTQFTRYAGGFNVSYNNNLVNIYEGNKIIESRFLNSLVFDVWGGRSFKPFISLPQKYQNRTRLITSVRYERPITLRDEKRVSFYNNSHLLLAEFGVSYRYYYRDRFVFLSGITEDIAEGVLFKVTPGIQLTNDAPLYYLGTTMAWGQRLKKKSYLAGQFAVGSYFNTAQQTEGVLSLNGLYFSDLHKWNSWSFREFVRVNLTTGFNTPIDQFINLNEPEGLRGFSNRFIQGKSKMVLSLRSLIVTPLKLVGFRFSVNLFADMALMSDNRVTIFKSPLYKTYGLGLTIRNDKLIIQNIELAFVFYSGFPVIPLQKVPNWDFIIDLTQPINTDIFEFDKPELVIYK